jgi:hypothetical protein
MAASRRWLQPLRALHLHLGLFTAPALLFLAFTGALQSVNLHEATRGRDYRPPAWVASLAHMHKKQSFDVPTAKRAPSKSPSTAAAVTPVDTVARPAARVRDVWPMKAFFVLVAASLLLSTATGVIMALRATRGRRRYWATLAAGVVVPAALILF